MVQVVQCLPRKHEALSSHPNIIREREREREREEGGGGGGGEGGGKKEEERHGVTLCCPY
jgi:hypothetical protein